MRELFSCDKNECFATITGEVVHISHSEQFISVSISIPIYISAWEWSVINALADSLSVLQSSDSLRIYMFYCYTQNELSQLSPACNWFN